MALWLAAAAYAQNISITAPADASTISGTVSTAATLTSISNTCTVEWSLNSDVSILLARLASQAYLVRAYPWSYSLKTAAFPDGTYTITATARDCLGTQLATDTNTFTIDNNACGLSITTLADPVSGASVDWTVTASGTSDGYYYFFIDGRLKAQQLNNLGSATYTFDSTAFENGTHVLEAFLVDRTVANPTYTRTCAGAFRRATFSNTTTVDMELRPSARQITMTPSETYAITAVMRKVDGSESAQGGLGCSSNNTAAATVSSCTVTAVANGRATITVTGGGKSNTMEVLVRTSKNTPHFGKDGSLLTSYSSSNSALVFSMHGIAKAYFDLDATLKPEVEKSGLNAIEENFYYAVAKDLYTEANWKSGQDTLSSQLQTFIDSFTAPFRYLLIGDGMLRGGDVLGDAVGGPQSAWTPTAVTYAARKLAATLKVWGIATVDEITKTWGCQPRPNFTMGQGLTKVVVSGGTATGTLTRICGLTATGTIAIEGAVTSGFNTSSVAGACGGDPFTTISWATSAANGEYNSSGTGCSGSPCVAEPNLAVKIFKTMPVFTTSPTTPAVVETAFTYLYDRMKDLTSGVMNIGWPVAGDAHKVCHGEWNGVSTLADFALPQVACAAECGIQHPLGSSPAQGKADRESKLLDFFPYTQQEKPKLIQGGWAGQSFYRGGQAASLTSISGNTVTSAASNAAAGSKARIQGASLTAHNDWFHIGRVFSSTSFELMNRNAFATLGDCNSGTVTGESGWTRTISLFQGEQLSVTAAYPGIGVGEHVTVSGCAQGGYNKQWIYLSSYSSTNIQVRDFPTGSSTGGTIRIAVGSAYDPAYDIPLAPGTNIKDAFTSTVMGYMMSGFSGGRSYASDRGSSSDRALAFPVLEAKRSDNSLTSISVSSGTATINLPEPHRMSTGQQVDVRGFAQSDLNGIKAVTVASSTTLTYSTSTGNGTYTDAGGIVYGQVIEEQQGADPLIAGSDAAWRAQSYGWLLGRRLEPFLLQPILPSPHYGYCLYTEARGPSTYGRLLMALNICDVPVAQTIDYTPYLYSGRPISEYRADWMGIRTRVASGTSASYTIQPGEVVALLFHDASAAYVVTSTLTVRPTDQPTASKVALRYGYIYNEALDLVTTTVSCSAGICSPAWDRRLGDIWYWYEYLNSSDVVQARSDRMRLTQL